MSGRPNGLKFTAATSYGGLKLRNSVLLKVEGSHTYVKNALYKMISAYADAVQILSRGK